MARITVEDCVTIVKNRFELCLIASNRARAILSGVETAIETSEKPAVISLREIAAELVDVDVIRKNIIDGIRNRVPEADSARSEMIKEEIKGLTQEASGLGFVDEEIVDD